MIIVFQIGNPIFLSSGNIMEMLRATTLYFIVACPMTLVLVSGGIDFSAGALFATGGVTAGLLMVLGLPWPIAVIIGMAVGGALGIVNAWLSVRLRVPPLIATLGMFFTASGIITVVTGGNSIYGFPKAFTDLGQGFLLGIPFLVYYAVVVGVVFWILLEKTSLGYDARAVGGNRAAASANGIRVGRHDFIVYGLAGAVAALAGIMGAARLSSANPAAGGTALTFQVVTAVIIGGTSLFGGIGSIGGSALGALLFAVINNGLVIINVNSLWQNIFVGVILVSAVAIDQARRRRQFTSRR
ncbi:MAG: ABC transporter permease [Salinibacterium sp.]|nr:ABC transporter permease [Salinibacterium sp.]